ncbi:MAG: SRPBCC family protein, partial [Actinobacteria bacterium]|nr:SRPBCC family protein [Actinomycetota bacterium]
MPSSRRSRVLGTVTTLAPVLAQTAKVVAGDVVDRLRPGTDRSVADPGVSIPEPEGTADYARRVHATGTVTAAPAEVVGLLTDLDRAHEWLTLHRSWRGERPSRMETGAEFTQQISLMDIPAQARWSVARVDADGFELRGTGPMGITVGLWAAVVPTPAGSGVRLDGALDGPPVKGPVGLTAVRSVEVALAESLARVAELLGGAEGGARLRVADEPVLHERTGALLEPTTPVVIGVGQVVR